MGNAQREGIRASRAEKALGWIISFFWAGGAGYLAFASGMFGSEPSNLLNKVVLSAAGVAAGAALAFIVVRLSRRASVVGVALGHFAVVPPAVQLGMLAGQLGSQQAMATSAVLALPAFAGALLAAIVAVATLGALVGLGSELLVRAALRPLAARLRALSGNLGWRALRTAVLLLGLAGAALYAAERQGMLPWSADAPEASAWIEREKALFASVLATQRYDIVVLPVQAEGKSFDRIARSLMTRYLARHVEIRTGGRLPDHSLLARALDQRARRIDPAESRRLAEKLGAEALIETRVSRGAETFSVEAVLLKRSAAGWQEAARGRLKDLPFGDGLPASASMREQVNALLDQLKLPPMKATATPAPQEAARKPSAPPELLALATTKGGSPEERALRLQFMASLHGRNSDEAEELWERSLVALAGAARSVETSVLEARAYLHLERRPYALERLGEPATAAGLALRAALDGDVSGMETAIGAIEEPLARLIAEIELADLHHAYHLNPRLMARRAKLVQDSFSAFNVALRFRLSAPEWFSDRAHAEVAALLRPLLRADSFAALAVPWMYWAYWFADPLAQHGFRAAIWVEDTYVKAWRSRAPAWAAERAADRLAERDYYELLYAINRAAALKSVGSMIFMQALPEAAESSIRALGGAFKGHPRLTYYHAAALDRIGRKLPAAEQAGPFTKSSALALSVYRWEQGETHVSSSAEALIFERKYQRYDDEPIRWYRRREVPPSREYADRIRFTPQEMEQYIAEARRQLAYSDRFPAPLRDLTAWLRRAGHRDAVAQVVAENRHRFVGNADRVALLDEIQQRQRSGGEVLPLYLELLELDPDGWNSRWRVAALHMESGRPKEAQEAFLAYPPFSSPPPNDRVRLSNVAYAAGEYLYRSGETALAMPLFILSARMQTGSAREMRSREMLALDANDMAGTLRQVRAEIDRYNSSSAGMRYVLYLAMLGRLDEAQSALAGFLGKFDDESVWTSAFIAHRMLGLEGPEAEKWLAEAAAAAGRKTYFTAALRERHAFMLAFIDRRPTKDGMEHLRRVVKANNGSWFYLSIAEGYAALRQADYALAAEKLRRPFNDIFAISVTRQQQLTDLLPYVVLAYSRGGKRDEAEKILDSYLNLMGQDSDYLIARALLDGADRRHGEAITALRRAFLRLPGLSTRTFFSGYVLLEACAVLLRESGHEAYRELIEDLARRLQVLLPNPWAAAYEARYARDVDTRQLAIAAASVLDARSPQIAHVPQAERDALRRAVARHGSVLGVAMRSGDAKLPSN